MLRLLTLFVTLLLVASCSDECEGPVDIGEFRLSDLAKSYNPFPAEGSKVIFTNESGNEKSFTITMNQFKELGFNSFPVRCPADTTQVVSGSSRSDFFRIELYDEVDDRYMLVSIGYMLDNTDESGAFSLDGEEMYIVVGKGRFFDTNEDNKSVLNHIISLGNRQDLAADQFSTIVGSKTILGKDFFDVIEDAHPTLVRETQLRYNRDVGIVSFQIDETSDEWVFDRFE